MRPRLRLQSSFIQALSQSMTVDAMERLARQVIPDYDLHARSGFPPNIPIPKLDAARRITDDMIQEGHLRRFTEVLIEVDRDGFMGRPVTIRSLPQIINEIELLGFVFKEEYGVFVEGREREKTRGWGVLREGAMYEFTFLSVDIAGSSELVRTVPEQNVARAYAGLKHIFASVVNKREGRVWSWKGDGGLAAFYFGNKNVQAALAGMETLLELFLYNLYSSPLGGRPLEVRLVSHTGPCTYQESIETIRSDTLRRLEHIESRHAPPGTLTVSPPVYSDMGSKLESFFRAVAADAGGSLYQYRLEWE